MTHAVVPPAMSSDTATRNAREAAVKRVNVRLHTAGCLAHSMRPPLPRGAATQRFRQPLSSAPRSFLPSALLISLRLVPLPQSPAAAEPPIFSPRPR